MPGHLPFYLRRSPGQGTVRVVVVLVVVVVVVGALFQYRKLCVFWQYDVNKSCRSHEDKQLFFFVQLCVTNHFCINRQKQFDDFVDFYVFGRFYPLNDLQSKI